MIEATTIVVSPWEIVRHEAEHAAMALMVGVIPESARVGGDSNRNSAGYVHVRGGSYLAAALIGVAPALSERIDVTAWPITPLTWRTCANDALGLINDLDDLCITNRTDYLKSVVAPASLLRTHPRYERMRDAIITALLNNSGLLVRSEMGAIAAGID